MDTGHPADRRAAHRPISSWRRSSSQWPTPGFAHGPYLIVSEHEKRIGRADSGWPDWYAEYTVPEQSGKELPG
jgi:hypothetical protein